MSSCRHKCPRHKSHTCPSVPSVCLHHWCYSFLGVFTGDINSGCRRMEMNGPLLMGQVGVIAK